MARKNCSRHVSKSPLSKARAAAAYCTSACACFNALSMACRLLESSGKTDNLGTDKNIRAADRLFQLNSFKRCATAESYISRPPANTPPVKSMTTRLKVKPWLLCTVMAHAEADGILCESTQFLLPSISFFSSLYL